MKTFIAPFTKTTIRGLVRTIWGALTANLLGLAVYGFTAIPSEGGYTAVCDFIGAVCILCLAFVSVYVQGFGSFKKPKRQEVK